MGYITYLGGTLIIVVAIHFLWTKSHEETRSPNVRHGGVSSQNKDASTVEEHKESLPAGVPAVLVEDGDLGIDVPASQPDGSVSQNVLQVQGSQKDEKATKPNLQPVAATTSKSTLAMPPPALPVLHEPARTADAIQSTSMPPPSLVASQPHGAPRLKPPTSSIPPQRKPTTSLGPPPSAASSLRIPQQKVLTNTHMQPSTSTQHPSKRSSRKVILSPGHSPLDWASLTKSTSPSAPLTLRGKDATTHFGPYKMGRITPSQLKYQNGRKGKDAWTSYQGRIYNIGAYLDFHPGGVDELMKGAGRSSDKLFAEVHPWVNWEGMLGECLIGMLVSEDDASALGQESHQQMPETKLDEMD